jgi:L-threonylcarbamoyladenylate synthase
LIQNNVTVPNEIEIQQCLEVLGQGGTILYPTDTIWGIGCDATDIHAVEKVYRLKKRMETKSLIILVDTPERISGYVESIPEIAWDLLKHVDTPLTIIYPNARNLAPNVVAEDQSIAIRVVRNTFCRQLIRRFGKPIVSTSANISGSNPPLVFKNISAEITENVDYVVPLYQDRIQQLKPSRIIKLNENGEFRIIRK